MAQVGGQPMPDRKFETILVNVEKRIATVTLNRPDVRNAFHPTMIRELTDFFNDSCARKDLVAIILRGAGPSFCAGADLGYMQSMAGFSFDENLQDSKQLFAMFWAMHCCPLPIVGHVHGHVMGGGLGLLANCDVSAAVSDTVFCFAEVRLGLAPAVISPFVMEKMQSAYAQRYMLTGEMFDTKEAHDSGLVHFVGDETAVDDYIKKISRTLCGNGAEAMRATKSLMRNMRETPEWAERRILTTKVIAERRVSPEGQEGLRSFLEKRQPKWTPADS